MVALAVLGIAGIIITSTGQERDRSKMPDKYKWNLADIYPSEAAWREARDKFKDESAQIAQYKGRLMSSAATLAAALEKQSALDKELTRIYSYASLLADQDTRDSGHQGMRQQMGQIAANFSAQAAYMEPEILKADTTTIDRYIASEPRLNVYRFYLDDMIRRAAHTLTTPRRSCSPTRPAGGLAVEHLQHSLECGFPVSDRHAERRANGQGRSGGLQRTCARCRTARDREKVMSAFFNGAGRVQPHVRHDDERRSAEGAVLCQGAQVFVRRSRRRSTGRTSRCRSTRA